MKKLFILVLLVCTIAGCATSVRYVNYTDRKYPPKNKYYFVTIYPETQQLPATQPYIVIGRVELSGLGSDGVSPDTLTDKAKAIARKRGADAIINSRIEALNYERWYAVDDYRWHHYYHPMAYIPYADVLYRFRGELIVFVPSASAGK